MSKKEKNTTGKYSHLIVNRQDRMSSLRKTVEISMTTFGWMVWLVLLRPVFVVLLWLLGFRFFYVHMVYLGGIIGLAQVWWIYASIIGGLVICVRAWGVYNKSRFGGKDQRRAAVPVKPHEVEYYFDLSEGAAANIAACRDISIDLDDKTRAIKIRDSNNETGYYHEGRFIPD